MKDVGNMWVFFLVREVEGQVYLLVRTSSASFGIVEIGERLLFMAW